MFDLAVYISKYVFVLIAAGFQCFNIFYLLRDQNKPAVRSGTGGQFVLLCLFHIIASLVLYNENTIIISAGGLAFFISAYFGMRFLTKNSAPALWNNVFMLMDTGLIMLLRLNPSSAGRQFIWFVVGICVSIICFNILRLLPKAFTGNRILPYLLLIITFAFLTLPFFLGRTINGANNWVTLWGYSFQPSEIAKIVYVLCLAGALRNIESVKKETFFRVFLLCTFSAFCVIILVTQRDLGGALIFFAVFVAMLYAATGSKLFLLASMLSVSGAAVLSYFIFPHIRVRIAAWLNPWNDMSAGGYQILQSLFAMGTWGPSGSGLTKGMPGTIPVVESDFIFAAITEEFGVFFALLLICSYIFILCFGIKTAWQHSDKTKEHAVIGFSSLLALQSFLIIGGCIRLLPITGVTLPFVSYGGSSVVVCLIITGMLSWLSLPDKPSAKSLNPLDKKASETASTGISGVIDKDDSLAKQKNREYRPANKNSIVLGTFLLFYIIAIVFLCKFVFFDSAAITANSYNQRLKSTDLSIRRGNLYDRNLKILATTDYSEASSSNGTASASIRRYPYAEKTAHITGYLDRGGAGAEARYNFELQKPGKELFQRVSKLFSDEPLEANSMVLTIDADLSALIYDRFAAWGQKGSAVVIEPSTGRLLAMVSYPSYDPNKIAEQWIELSSDSSNSLLLNRAAQGLYPPGSVFKIITASAALSAEASSDYESFVYDCMGEAAFGFEKDAEVKIRCFDYKAHGQLDLTKAFSLSCNTFFASKGLELGGGALQTAAEKALFNSPLDFPLSYNKSSFELSENSSVHDTIQTSIGQGKTLVTPLHMAMLTSAVANGGIMMQPYIRDYILNGSKPAERTYPKKLADVYTIEEAALLRDLMTEVVKSGTGVNAAIDGIEVAGKTGTAENASGDDHGWFVAFAPADNPEIALAILLENSGGPKRALPLAKEIIEYELLKGNNGSAALTP